MNTKLEQAFLLLETEGSGFNGPLEGYPAALWESVELRLPEYGPTWYRQLTERFRVGGAYFTYSVDPDRDYIGDCTIFRPSTLSKYIDGDHFALPELFEQGFFCFADGEDGSLWMFRNDATNDPPVFFLDLSAWGGGIVASSDTGLISPALTLSQLLRHGAAWRPKK